MQKKLCYAIGVKRTEGNCFGVACGLVTNNKNISVSGAATRKGSDDVHGDPFEGDIHDGEWNERGFVSASRGVFLTLRT